MSYTPVVVTADNIIPAINENFSLIYKEMGYKVPMNGKAVLQGDWDFQNLYTILGVVSDGPNSALPNSENV